jgi:UDP-2,3-diacylglucosamine pyrophosphatase LpxH
MLVMISDLHLNDGSAAPDNISPKAFAIWMKDVLALAEQNEAKELVFVYLGDMVDLLRTEYWFYPKPGEPLADQQQECFPLDHRPWGDRDINQHPDRLTEACRARSREILEKIRQKTSKQLSYLRGEADGIKDDLAALGIPIRRYYVPGNHDRLFWVDQEVQKGILDAFGATLPPGPRPFELVLPEYGMVARHGHEWDPWNFENCDKNGPPSALKLEDYKLVAVGDPITTELVARLPYQVAASLPQGTPEVVRTQVYCRLRQVEDVRPLSQALRWVLTEPASLASGYDETTRRTILKALETEVKRIVAHFMAIPFVQGWLAKHDKWNVRPDEADMLQDVHRLSKVLDIDKLDSALQWAEKLGLTRESDDSKQAVKEVGQFPAARFCVYGHTHTFRHVPVGQTQSREDLVYFNTGTWRPRVALARDDRSFAGYKEMTYLVFYRADEDMGSRDSKDLSYELWNGMMRK